MRKRFAVGTGLVIVVIVGTMLVYHWTKLTVTPVVPEGAVPGITPENFRRLHKGMTEKEVEEIMGGAADNSPRVIFNMGYSHSWSSEGCIVWIEFGFSEGARTGTMKTSDGLTLEMQEKKRRQEP